MKWFVVAALFPAACISVPGPQCDDEPQCVHDGTCSLSCVKEATCCECLEQVSCLVDGLNAKLCEDNLSGGGTIRVAAACSDDSSRCGVECNGVLSPAGAG